MNLRDREIDVSPGPQHLGPRSIELLLGSRVAFRQCHSARIVLRGLRIGGPRLSEAGSGLRQLRLDLFGVQVCEFLSLGYAVVVVGIKLVDAA